MKLFHLLLSTSCATLLVMPAFAVEKELTKPQQAQAKVMERVMVIGSEERAQEIAGSAHFIDKEALETFEYNDINRVLRQVPGVNLQEEEGYGNRPNIGFRGGRSERSADITLMEDGVLIAPAPYAAPSAYYFPRVSRMEGVEVRKGSSTIKFGPRTTSGALNLLSPSIPDEESGKLLFGYGSDNSQRAHGRYGNSHERFGYVLDFGHEASDGFKTIDRVGGDAGYSIQDVMGKFRVNTDPGQDVYQSLELKLGYTKEDSNETYLGLTDNDFRATPFLRYAASQEDNMDAEHQQYQLRHYIELDDFDVTTTLYHNRFDRNWYKLQSATVGGVTQSLDGSLNSAAHLAALKGNVNLDGGAANHLTMRANNREYYATGLQTDVGADLEWGDTRHGLEFGFRQHRDTERRFQHDDDYGMTNGDMQLSNPGAPGSQDYRKAFADATALYMLDEIGVGNWTFTPGMRYEYIRLKQDNYRSNSKTRSQVDAWMPGMGVAYDFDSGVTAFGGVHRGFAPPSPGNADVDVERSTNYEAGLRYSHNALRMELVGFFTDYSNLIATCTASSSCAGNIGDQFNGGEVEAKGLEASIGYDLAEIWAMGDYRLPVTANYTLTRAEFQSDFSSSFDEWGNVTKGDELPYIPEHQFYLSAGLVAPKWEIHLGGKFVDTMRTEAGSGLIPAGSGTDSHFVVDAAGEYEVYDKTRLFLLVDNLFDEEYAAARRPAGLRPGMPMTVLAGVKYAF